MHDPALEKIFKDRKIKYTYEGDIPVEQLQRDASYQVRQLTNGKVNENDAKRLTELVKAGQDLGPVVLMKGPNGTYLIVEGNTRREAFIRGKRPTTAAYVVELESAKSARTLSLELNQRHGTRMKRAEVEDYFRSLNGDLPSAEEFVKITGYTKTTLERMIGAGKFDSRCSKDHIEQYRDIPQGTKVQLGRIALQSVFKDAAQLAFDARLSEKEAKDLVRKIAVADTEDTQRGIVSELHAELQPRIDDLKFGFDGLNSDLPRQISLHCGWIRNRTADGTINDKDRHSRARSKAHLESALESLKYALEHYYAEDEASPSA
jgi:hypothetical protein